MTLEELEARVTALEQRPIGADSFAPDSGQRIDANGLVTYDFTGHIHAQGIDLDAGTDIDASAADRKVRWTDTNTGAIVAEVYGFRGTVGGDPAAGTVVRAIPEPGTDAYARLEARDGALNQRIMVEAIAFDAGDYQARLRLHDGRVILLGDDLGASGFLQLATPDRLLFARDVVSVPPAFAGGGEVGMSIPHGLPDIPGTVSVSNSWVDAADTSSGFDEPVISTVTDVDATNINVLLFLPDGVTAAVGPGPIWWSATT